MAAESEHHASLLDKLRSVLGEAIEDAAEGALLFILRLCLANLSETFLLFAQGIPSQNLGFVDSGATSLDIDVGKRTYTIQQSPGILRSDRDAGTTGAVLWKVTPLLANWLSSTDNFLWAMDWLRSDSTVVELGCGVSGLIALCMAPLLSSGVYALTDQAYVMKILNQNLTVNQKSEQTGRSPHQRLQIRILAFDWETDAVSNITTLLGKDREIDLIVACDCIYNDYLIQPFVSTCASLCELRSDGRQKTGLLVAQQLRSEDVLQTWLDDMLKLFVVFRVPTSLLPEELRRGYVVHFAMLGRSVIWSG
jgi:predicted nicotinamide N-methyase